ncbi:MAG: hypothetical protein NC211_00805 [Alistipes senegalensis]|nr:hypothetical protein [Oxalobacter formigenes]MCM1280364.1 hypothetical protein [Alistipes senegalensis]
MQDEFTACENTRRHEARLKACGHQQSAGFMEQLIPMETNKKRQLILAFPAQHSAAISTNLAKNK